MRTADTYPPQVEQATAATAVAVFDKGGEGLHNLVSLLDEQDVQAEK